MAALAVVSLVAALADRRRRSADGRGSKISGRIEIEQPPEVVFDLVADERNEPGYNPRLLSVEKLTAGPVGTGTLFRAKVSARGRRTPMIIEYTAFERPNRLSSRTRMAVMDIAGTLTFQPTPKGTLLSWSWRIHPHGVLALLGPVVAGLGRRQERAIWHSLKHHLESS